MSVSVKKNENRKSLVFSVQAEQAFPRRFVVNTEIPDLSACKALVYCKSAYIHFKRLFDLVDL